MATMQSTIPFRARKLRQLSEKTKQEKFLNENLDYSNIAKNTVKKQLKRQKTGELQELVKSDNDSCSPTKVSRDSKEDKTNKISKSKSNEELTLTSRDTEIAKLQSFLKCHLSSKSSGSLYVSGQPGTGKTASLTHVLKIPQFKRGFKQVFVNCTMVKSADSIYMRICKELQLETSGSSKKACLSAIEKYFTSKHKMTLLVLDEMDQLESKCQSVLYSIFEWPSLPESQLVLIGVANALDLTERTLPLLQARCFMKPETIHFPPYTKQQIIDIFKYKIAQEDKGNVFSPVALQMLAAKVSAISGDMRRALDIGRRVIELAKRNKFQDNQSIDTLMNDTNVTVEIKQVLEVLNEVYGGDRKLQAELDEGLPIQQKLILCSLMLMLTKGKNKNIVVGNLYSVYKRVAHSRNLVALEMGEFVSTCGLLEARGTVRIGRGGPERARRVTPATDQAELCAALRDCTMLASVLEDRACLVSTR